MASTLVPAPTAFEEGEGEFVLDAGTSIAAPEELHSVLGWLQTALRPATGLPLHHRSDGAIALSIDPALDREEYRLESDATGVRIAGGTTAAVFSGCQALLQLLPSAVYRRARTADMTWSVPAVTIRDHPRFGWRGAMLDVARHFMPKHDVLRFIDLLAMHRLNVLHLHLTDDQGWRIEIKRYPKLTEVGSWRHETQVGASHDAPTDGRPHGGYYTQDDIREIVQYAADRQITVVPEIESPGHVQAALAAYPELSLTGEPFEVFTRWGINHNVLNVEESTVEFFTNVLDEVMELFPSDYIGVGGDECPKDQWENDPRTQERMRELGVADEEALQAWWIGRLDQHITARGRRMFGWDEILEGGLAEGATVASWRGRAGAIVAARKGHDVVSCPDDVVYLDYRQSDSPDEPIPVSIVLTLEDVYGFDPVPDVLTDAEAKHVLGGQVNVWTEHMDNPRTVDYLVFPRICAFAEALWRHDEGDFGDFMRRLDAHLQRLDAVGVEYRHATGPRPWQKRPGIVGRPATREEREAYIQSVVANIVA